MLCMSIARFYLLLVTLCHVHSSSVNSLHNLLASRNARRNECENYYVKYPVNWLLIIVDGVCIQLDVLSLW
jgi:hypothetical protein